MILSNFYHLCVTPYISAGSGLVVYKFSKRLLIFASGKNIHILFNRFAAILTNKIIKNIVFLHANVELNYIILEDQIAL